ncbi:hypothetical protein [Pedobacter sp. SL55]|uniref:hypothetical protein n=1 Tax=Pedobacter sp. SL55 TaxID=2995161 RepID=UPI00226E4728|nr:hypothetical protein [Pedobacter sp. SL55]WAC41078.1 hypothetical protein OVA16_01490 [Pedobacter sp. SL55]
MKLRAVDNIIEIRPNIEFANKLIAEELRQNKMYHRLHPSIRNAIGDVVIGKVLLQEKMLPLEFLGGNDKSLRYDGNILYLYNELSENVQKYSKCIPSLNTRTIDDILFITLFSWGTSIDPMAKDENEKYLEELITLYTQLKKRKVSVSLENIDFNQLPKDRQETIIYSDEVSVASRMVGGLNLNTLVHIPSEYSLVVKKDSEGDAEIFIPKRLSAKLYSMILEEIIEQHKAYDTKFYKRLSDRDFNLDELEDRTKPKALETNLRLLNVIAIQISNYLDQTNKFQLIAADKYRFIFSLLKTLNFIEKAKSQPEKYISKLLDDHKPEKYASKQGEKQFYRK